MVNQLSKTKMNRMKNIKTLGKIHIAMLAISVLFLDSCLKDKGPVEDFSQSPALVGFQYGGSAAQTFSAGILGTPTDRLTDTRSRPG